ncbi:BBL_G0045470.mRNA.1.CDS.1 [Saccharomyces cerevisiae]|nr:BBL_G0045470.mRNA.1.CDS.1 [Saccharomyces cerevisiae]CAI7307077.1 BBL_G0045470.mRNA.1.CDS.1 [Saccharomyces cerevisiae]
MAIENIYIARHGYRSNWLPKGPYPPPPTGIDNDVPLSEHGVEQAHELANYISKLDVKPEMIFSSPFYRCLETSKPTVEALKIPLYVDRGVGEWYKPDRPIIPEPATHEVMSKFFPSMISPDWEPSIIPSNKGETEEDIFERCHKFWPVFIDRVERKFPNVKTIMVVTHAATKSALGMNLLKFSSAKEPIDNKGTFIRNGSCAIDKFELVKGENESIPFEEREWKLTMNGNTSFLTNGEEMNWTFMNAFEAGSDADIKARRAAESGKLKME